VTTKEIDAAKTNDSLVTKGKRPLFAYLTYQQNLKADWIHWYSGI